MDFVAFFKAHLQPKNKLCDFAPFHAYAQVSGNALPSLWEPAETFVGLPRCGGFKKVVLCARMGDLGTRTDVQQVFSGTLWYIFKYGGTGGGGASITGTELPL